MRVWQKLEVVLHAARDYANPYTDVEVWVDLEGPGFARRCYGFWDGERDFVVRITAPAPEAGGGGAAATPTTRGSWDAPAPSRPADWSASEVAENPNRRGMIGTTAGWTGPAIRRRDAVLPARRHLVVGPELSLPAARGR